MRRFPMYLTLCASLLGAPAVLAHPAEPACDGDKKPKDDTANPDKSFAEPACDGDKKPKDDTDTDKS